MEGFCCLPGDVVTNVLVGDFATKYLWGDFVTEEPCEGRGCCLPKYLWGEFVCGDFVTKIPVGGFCYQRTCGGILLPKYLWGDFVAKVPVMGFCYQSTCEGPQKSKTFLAVQIFRAKLRLFVLYCRAGHAKLGVVAKGRVHWRTVGRPWCTVGLDVLLLRAATATAELHHICKSQRKRLPALPGPALCSALRRKSKDFVPAASARPWSSLLWSSTSALIKLAWIALMLRPTDMPRVSLWYKALQLFPESMNIAHANRSSVEIDLARFAMTCVDCMICSSFSPIVRST